MKQTSELKPLRIGFSEPRLDAFDKACGKTVYASDYYDRDMLWVGVKRAGVNHARLVSINVEEAVNLEGVVSVLTHTDIPGHKIHGVIRQDRPVLVFDRIRFPGDPVAVVVAETESALLEALEKITLDLEVLPSVTNAIAALEKGSILVHEDNPDGNVLLKADLTFGDAETAESVCPVIVEGEFETPVQEHAYLETESGWAQLGEDGKLMNCCSTQTPFRDCFEVAQILNMEPSSIRMIAPYCGGAFGGKDSLSVQAFLGLAALHSGGRPVKMSWSRKESFASSTKRHSATLHYRLGASTDGILQFLDVKIDMDAAPYDFLGGVVLTLALEHAGGPYRIPNSRVRGWLVYTNNPLGGAFRGFGVPQVTAAMEQMIDMLAEKLGICPLEIRLKNALLQGDYTFLGKRMNCSTAIVECLQALSDTPEWKGRETWKSGAEHGKLRGYGISALIHGMGYGPFVKDYANAKIELTDSGKLKIYSGVVDMGQGNASTYAQIAGHILNQSMEFIDLTQPDTFRTLPSCSSSASRTTYTFGKALIGACESLKDSVVEFLKEFWGVPVDCPVDFVPGGVASTLGHRIGLKELAELLPVSMKTSVSYFEAPTSSEILTSDEKIRMHGLPHEIFSFAAHLVFVEIDKATGCLEVVRYIAVSDCGAVLNPQIYEQQVHGSIAQGIGWALMENYSLGKDGDYPAGFSEYLIPTACDTPKVDCIPLNLYEPTGPFGLKGLGEISTAGPLPCIANALYNAAAIRIFDYPLTSEKVYRAMRNHG